MQKNKYVAMTAVILEQETNNYWELIKNVSAEVKLALISRLSASLISEKVGGTQSADSLINEILENAPSETPLTEEDILQEIKAVRYAV